MILSHAVLKASNLAAKDPNGKSDPYCQVYLGAGENSTAQRTDCIQSTLDPVWNKVIHFYGGDLAPFLYSTGVCVCVCGLGRGHTEGIGTMYHESSLNPLRLSWAVAGCCTTSRRTVWLALVMEIVKRMYSEYGVGHRT